MATAESSSELIRNNSNPLLVKNFNVDYKAMYESKGLQYAAVQCKLGDETVGSCAQVNSGNVKQFLA